MSNVYGQIEGVNSLQLNSLISAKQMEYGSFYAV